MHIYPFSVLIISWLFWTWETYLSYRQYRVYLTTRRVPDVLRDKIDDETFQKAKAYSIDKAKFGFISSLFNQVQSTVVLYYFLIPYFWNLSAEVMISYFGLSKTESIACEILQSLVFTFITSVASTLVGLPFSIYNTFVIEQKHGFNKQTAIFYAWDKLKMFAVSFSISAPVLTAVIYIVRNGGPYFFLYLWIFCFFVVLLLICFHGEIAALFDKFTPLPAGELRDKIEELAQTINFPLTNIFVVEGSKRSAHSNAYQSGVFKRKRVVIYDTLIQGYYDDKKGEPEEKHKDIESKEVKKGCNQDEILAVLCHELGHWYCGHLIKHLIFAEINYFFIFMIFSKFYNDPTFYSAFGFATEMPVLIGFTLLMMVMTPYNELLGFISTSLSRRFEFQADGYAKKRGHAEHLKTALIKLNVDNLGFPVHDELFSKFNHSHPTLLQRLGALAKAE